MLLVLLSTRRPRRWRWRRHLHSCRCRDVSRRSIWEGIPSDRSQSSAALTPSNTRPPIVVLDFFRSDIHRPTPAMRGDRGVLLLLLLLLLRLFGLFPLFPLSKSSVLLHRTCRSLP